MEPSLEIKYPFLTAMHPVHLEYLQDIPLFTPEQFVSILDNVDAEKRDKVMWGNYKAFSRVDERYGFSESRAFLRKLQGFMSAPTARNRSADYWWDPSTNAALVVESRGSNKH